MTAVGTKVTPDWVAPLCSLHAEKPNAHPMAMRGTKIRDVMTAPAIAIGPDTPFPDIVAMLLHYEISGVPVVDDGVVIGMVTEADLVAKESYGFRRRRPLALLGGFLRGEDPQWLRKASGRTAREVMTADPTTIGPDETTVAAAHAMLEWKHKRLPVVENGQLVGVVTRHDLLKPYHRSDAELDVQLEALLADPMRIPETHDAVAHVHDGIVTLIGKVDVPSDAMLIDAVVGRIPGVVAVENHLAARYPEPQSH